MLWTLGQLLDAAGAYVLKAPPPAASAGSSRKSLVPALVVAPLEEWLFRGVLLGLWLRFSRPAAACVGSSLLFAFLHFLKPPDGMAIADPAPPARRIRAARENPPALHRSAVFRDGFRDAHGGRADPRLGAAADRRAVVFHRPARRLDPRVPVVRPVLQRGSRAPAAAVVAWATTCAPAFCRCSRSRSPP